MYFWSHYWFGKMYFQRNIETELLEWKGQNNRKPILLRGARQVGKSSVVRHFAQNFDHFIEVNFDENADLCKLFSGTQNPIEICEQLSLLTKTPIEEGNTLLFFDEIQSCLPAISSLRYFYEKLPNLHLIAAGSLLEFALAELPSFGVGRIS
ncbi:MAG: AAA family ATPase [Flavobacteriales bacterium]|nr:AAA family ATPase [Flavobacteriales bacterium]